MTDYKLFAVTGKPILHSKSPDIFNNIFANENVPNIYFRLAASNAQEAIQSFKTLKLSGMSVTAPCKTNIIQLIDYTHIDAKKINAVNTVVNKNGKISGFNTDFISIINSLKNKNIEIANKQCLVIGAGGAARAVVYALTTKNAKVTIVNRTIIKAKLLSTEFNCSYDSFEKLEANIVKAEIIVNCLPVNIEIPFDKLLNKNQVLIDMVYKKSSFTEAAQKIGCTLIKGEEILINQAIPAYHHFFDKQLNNEIAKKLLSDKTKKINFNKIAIIGFMGVGKTSIAKNLANELNYEFIDTDQIIEKNENQSITNIFKTKGEDYFRTKEKETLKNFLNKNKIVLSCGGGIIIDNENIKLLKKKFLVVWLFSSIETSIKRITDNSRPLINDNSLTNIEKIYKKRLPLYAQTCDIAINIENKSISEISQTIIFEIEMMK
ncbi:MAG: AAA family ATPase [Bacteroidetes bacterium]|nr:AAA family ATPase [Bacteroidota bacterium]